MDNNWRPAQEPNTMDGADWRTQLQPDSRQRIVNKIMETLKRHLPFSGPEGLIELREIAVRFEEKIYSAATSQSDYLRKISLKMLTMETKSQNPAPNAADGNQNLPNLASQGLQPHMRNQVQQPPIPLPNQSQTRQQLLSQNLPNNIAPGIQSSSSLSSALSSITNPTPVSMPNAVGQSSSIENISGMSQNSVGNSVGQGVPSNMFASTQGQMPGRQHPQQVASQQNHQQTQNPQQYLYQQQQLQQQMMQMIIQQQMMKQQQQHQQQRLIGQQNNLSNIQQQQQLVGQQNNMSNLHQQQLQQQNHQQTQNPQQYLYQQQQLQQQMMKLSFESDQSVT